MQPPPFPPPSSGGGHRRGSREGQHPQSSDDGGKGSTIVLGIFCLLLAAGSAAVGWWASKREEEAEVCYYTLPDRDRSCAGREECDEVNPDASDSARRRCVCCLDRPQRFMFVQCGHICMCEPCLIRMGREYEDKTLRRRFNGPVRLACPICRLVGFVVKTYES
ncbi:hypothetical protein ABL78_8143 [Leptomonas seymouri]|uniref:RING-type domain-containing protein n=1 Tax=Leptomonas seymouri TaxID=5684 RepID=A0A0N1HT25_LEPSE|nr:hypothetical protein ABL78_8143 [Leptomonas seymouri]|eukprot:KPI82845.1 hypothetical protein ABL78_8143 [Leptomonas seymouri]